jgi:hypothetical protein
VVVVDVWVLMLETIGLVVRRVGLLACAPRWMSCHVVGDRVSGGGFRGGNSGAFVR